MTHVLLAPDKFKGSLTADEVSEALARGLRAASAETSISVHPVADGGDGTVAAACSAGFELVTVEATGPTGTPLTTGYARRGDTAIVEMADVVGLRRLPDGVLRPMAASSRGLGEVMAAAIDRGARRLIVGLGGSSSTDGGLGMLRALGMGIELAPGASGTEGGQVLERVVSVDPTTLDPRLADVEIVLATDVDNPLTGPDGAAATYAAQKGATTEQIAHLDQGLTHWADLLAAATGDDRRVIPGAGAAGGTGFAALAALGAESRPGIDVLLDLTGFEESLARADLVVVGEGSLDAQSLHGKAPVGVARRARAAGRPVIAVCGRLQVDAEALHAAGIEAAHALTDLEPSPERCMADAARLLEEIGRRIALERLPRVPL